MPDWDGNSLINCYNSSVHCQERRIPILNFIIVTLLIIVLLWVGFKLFSRGSGKSRSSGKGANETQVNEQSIRKIAKQTVMEEFGEELAALRPQMNNLENIVNQLVKQQQQETEYAKKTQDEQQNKLIDNLTEDTEQVKKKIAQLNKNSANKQ